MRPVGNLPNVSKLNHGHRGRTQPKDSNKPISYLVRILNGQWPLAPARGLAHWTITQRQNHIVLANKSWGLNQEKGILAGTLGDSIRAARKEAGLTQEKLAKLTGVHRQWLGRWERGRAFPPVEARNKLSAILNLPAAGHLE